ncbi:hypothetical protein EXW56_16255 [Bacillus mycoides]|nr:hypothetical protein EXW56_16255 [Bacillus mycoides]
MYNTSYPHDSRLYLYRKNNFVYERTIVITFTFLGKIYSLFKLSRYSPSSKTPTSNSAKAKKLGGDQLPVNARLVKANNQWG